MGVDICLINTTSTLAAMATPATDIKDVDKYSETCP